VVRRKREVAPEASHRVPCRRSTTRRATMPSRPRPPPALHASRLRRRRCWRAELRGPVDRPSVASPPPTSAPASVAAVTSQLARARRRTGGDAPARPSSLPGAMALAWRGWPGLCSRRRPARALTRSRGTSRRCLRAEVSEGAPGIGDPSSSRMARSSSATWLAAAGLAPGSGACRRLRRSPKAAGKQAAAGRVARPPLVTASRMACTFGPRAAYRWRPRRAACPARTGRCGAYRLAGNLLCAM